MKVVFDPRKDRKNRRKHGVSLSRAAEMDFDAAYIHIDDSQDYGEVRYIAFGFIAIELFVLVFTDTDIEDTIRVITLRRAEPSEEIDYAENG
jgi:uncharacterized DUF497 family protein